MKLSMKKEEFLLNTSNKQRFLEKLIEIMNEGSLTAIQAPGEADLLIVSTALDLSMKHHVAIVGEDIDLLALTLQYATAEQELFLTAPPLLLE